jgi:hypothetical protein
MGIDREDVLGVLAPHEVPLMTRAEAAGIPANSFYRKLKQFQATYPETWQKQVEEWLVSAKQDKEKDKRISALKEQIKAKKISLLALKHEDEEEALLAEAAALDKELADRQESKPKAKAKDKAKQEE